MAEFPSPYDEQRRRAHSVFASRVGYEDFRSRFDPLVEDTRGRILRSTYIYQKAMKMLELGEPDIAMALLCSAVESTHSASNSVTFADWLRKHRLDELTGMTRDELDRLIQESYQAFLDTETEREGAFYNFRRFLQDHCPETFRSPPMLIFPRGETGRTASFNEGIGYVYSKFRSLFLHEGIGRLETSPTNETIVYSDLTDVYRRDGITIDMLEVSRWFGQVVVESLWHWIMSL